MSANISLYVARTLPATGKLPERVKVTDVFWGRSETYTRDQSAVNSNLTAVLEYARTEGSAPLATLDDFTWEGEHRGENFYAMNR